MLPYAFIKPSELDEKTSIEIDYDNDSIRVERRTFNIRTYDALRKNALLKLEPANRFVRENFDKDEYDYLVRLFVRSKRELINADSGEAIVDAVGKIDGYVHKCFKKLNLANRIYNFVKGDKNISLPDFAKKEMRPQDTEEKTFYEEDYHQVNTIIIMSKILVPIFGEIINRVKVVNDSYKNTREIVAFGIINSVLRDDFEAITKKLQNYVFKLIDRFLSDESMIVFNGITSTSLTDHQFSKIVVKSFANHDFYVPDGNIIRSVCVTLKRTIDHETNASNRPITYFERMTPKSSDDDRNDSLFENSVNPVTEATEIPVLVKAAITDFIRQYIIDNRIDPKVFDGIVQYYKVTIVQPTIVNEILTALFISEPVLSAYCTKYMDMNMMIQIITLIQIYMFKHGFKELVPLLTLTLTDIAKTETNDIDNRIILNNGRSTIPNTTNYHFALAESIAHLSDWTGFNFGEYMKSIMIFIVENVHMFNIAPGLAIFGNTGTTCAAENGVLTYDENIISELHRFMYHLLKVADVERSLHVNENNLEFAHT